MPVHAIALKLLDGLIDIYMPDFKFWESTTVRDLCKAKDYPERAREAITEMHRQVGPLTFGPDDLAKRGVLVRHLVMPAQQDESEAIFRWLAEAISLDTYVNIMGQYRPDYEVGQIARNGNKKYASINRHSDDSELSTAFALARKAGLWRFDTR